MRTCYEQLRIQAFRAAALAPSRRPAACSLGVLPAQRRASVALCDLSIPPGESVQARQSLQGGEAEAGRARARGPSEFLRVPEWVLPPQRVRSADSVSDLTVITEMAEVSHSAPPSPATGTPSRRASLPELWIRAHSDTGDTLDEISEPMRQSNSSISGGHTSDHPEDWEGEAEQVSGSAFLLFIFFMIHSYSPARIPFIHTYIHRFPFRLIHLLLI